MKYAVVQTGGKQYLVAEGDIVAVEKLDAKENEEYIFPTVLLYVNEEKRQVGSPHLSKVIVSATVLGNKKTKKVRVAKFKAKAKCRRVSGHRSIMTNVKIEKIAVK